MPSHQNVSIPLGVKIITGWSVLTGLAALVLSFAQTVWCLPLAGCLLLGAIGVWKLQWWGLGLLAIGYIFEGFRGLVEGSLVKSLVVVVLLVYLYSKIEYAQRLRIHGKSST